MGLGGVIELLVEGISVECCRRETGTTSHELNSICIFVGIG